MIVNPQNAVRHIFRVAPGAAHGIRQPLLTGSLMAIVVLVALIASVPASAQTTPEAPALCIEESGNCGSVVPVSAGAKKWNPGHYIKPQGNHSKADQADYYAAVTRQIASVNDSPEIKGALIGYAWGAIEPTTGNYNWDPIYTHLNYLSARGKKLMIMILVKCFHTDCTNLAPSDMKSEVFVTERSSPTSIVEVWEEKNMDVFITMMDALAAEFDDNPAVEMVMGTESAPSLQGSTPASFTSDGFATQLKRMYSAQAAAFKDTNVIGNVNFLGGQVSGLIEHAYQVGAGRGMADIFDSSGAFVFRGECSNKDCGVRDYRGLVPHLGIVSDPTLRGKHSPDTDTPAEVIAYGVANAITHYAWVGNESGEDSWPNVVAAIEAANPDGHTACPTVYSKGCK